MKKLQETYFFKAIKKRFLHEEVNLLDVEGLDYLRCEIFSLSFKILFFFCIPMFIYFMIRMILQEDYLAAAVDALFIITYLGLIIIKSIPKEIRNIIMILSVCGIGLIFILQINAEASGFIVLLSIIIFSGFMVETKTSIRIILITILVVLFLTIFLFTGSLENLSIASHKGTWVINIINLYSYGVGIFLLVKIMIVGLNKQAEQIKEVNKLVTARQKRYQVMIKNIEDVIMIVDSLGIVKYSSPNVGKIYGWEDEEILNHSRVEKIYADDRDKAVGIFRNVLKGTNQKERLEIRHASKNGGIKNLEISLTDLRHDPVIAGVLINFHDITQRRAFEKKIMHMNYHDDLTGLYNRTYFNKIKEKMDGQDYLPLSLISADVDGLKIINDSFGHLEGDAILKLAAQLFKGTFRKEDIIARIGGDEFAILLPRTGRQDSYHLIDRLSIEISRYNQENTSHAHYLSISLGLATKIMPGEHFDDVMKKADYQMYEQKNRKKKDLNEQIIVSIKKALFSKLPNLKESAKRWARIAKEIGRAVGLSDEALKQVDLLAVLGELGKIAIDDKILIKTDALSDQEKKSMINIQRLATASLKQHPDGVGLPHAS